MPIYVYECSACHEIFEVQQRITEDPLKDCACGSQGTVKRLIQPTAIMFKGSGFYVNDSASGAGKAAKSEETVTAAEPTTTDHAVPKTTPSE